MVFLLIKFLNKWKEKIKKKKKKNLLLFRKLIIKIKHIKKY